MTAFSTDHQHEHAADGAYLAALPADPLAAYALGMLHMLQRTRSSIHSESAGCEVVSDGDEIALQVMHFLSDAFVPADEKRALVATIEHAADLADVKEVLHLHALADAAPAALGGRVLPNQDGAPLGPIRANQAHEETLRTPDDQEIHHDVELIPEALGCAICCDELMLKPVSLLCGHSFCKRCLDMWLKSCANCPTCRQSVLRASLSPATTAVNVALHDVMTALFPDKLKQLEDRDHMERLDVLRALIAKSIESGQSIRELVAQQEQLRDGDHDARADVSELLESDVALQEQVMAAEIRERLRKEKLLREASRRRHLVAYCGALPVTTSSHMRVVNGVAYAHAGVSASPPTPSVQSNRPVKKYVPPPPKKSAFFASLLRRKTETH